VPTITALYEVSVLTRHRLTVAVVMTMCSVFSKLYLACPTVSRQFLDRQLHDTSWTVSS